MLRILFILFTTLLLVSCTESEEKLRDGDRQKLNRMVELDQRVSKAMKEADDRAIKGDAQGAVEKIHSVAKPAVEEADRLLRELTDGDGLGKTKRDEMRAVISDRKKEMPRYEEAVKSGEAQKLLDAMEAQAAIERRALAMVAAFEGR